MQVRVLHQDGQGTRNELCRLELDHMPPRGEPIPLQEQDCSYVAAAYFGPDEQGEYVLLVEGEPLPLDARLPHRAPSRPQ